MDKREGKFIAVVSLAFLILFLFITRCTAHADVDTSRAVIHHTDSHDVSVVEIDRWHKERGWSGVGYHFVIRKNGDIEAGRPLSKNGAHALGRNHYVGIALTGRDTFTQLQYHSLKKLIKRLRIKTIEPHHEACPGKGFNYEKVE